jgi:hypothetical protein
MRAIAIPAAPARSSGPTAMAIAAVDETAGIAITSCGRTALVRPRTQNFRTATATAISTLFHDNRNPDWSMTTR